MLVEANGKVKEFNVNTADTDTAVDTAQTVLAEVENWARSGSPPEGKTRGPRPPSIEGQSEKSKQDVSGFAGETYNLQNLKDYWELLGRESAHNSVLFGGRSKARASQWVGAPPKLPPDPRMFDILLTAFFCPMSAFPVFAFFVGWVSFGWCSIQTVDSSSFLHEMMCCWA